MTLIIVSGIPPRWDMKFLMRKLITRIKGKYEVLTIKCTKKNRSGYIRLSEMLDPQKVVNSINSKLFGKCKLQATIPDEEPILPSRLKPVGLPMPLRRHYHIANEGSPGEVLYAAHSEILEELQSKFAGLFKLSKTTGDQLLQAIAEEILGKLRLIMIKGMKEMNTSCKLTRQYRNLHPHHCDFTLILSNLNNIERAAGKPDSILNQVDLITPRERPYVLSNMPLDKVQVICNKYAKAISNKLQRHITDLKTSSNDAATVEKQVAVQRVRTELKKITPYIPMMIQIVVKENILQKKSMYYRVRIYGEPQLPTRDMMAKFLKKYFAQSIYRSDRIFNLLYCKIPLTTLPKFAEADGTNICGSIMIIRLSDVDYYKVPDAMVSEMLSFRPVQPMEPMLDESEWNETWQV